MKTRIFVVALTAALGWPAVLQAQVTVSSFLTNDLAEPYNIAVDSANNSYISDSVHNRILRVDAGSGSVTTLAGLPDEPAGVEDGPAYAARFNSPQGLVCATVGGQNGVVVSDSGNHLIRFIRSSDGQVSTLAGIANPLPPDYPIGGSADGGLGISQLDSPLGLASDGAGRIYIADSGNNAIRVLDLATLNVTTLTVTGTTFNQPNAVTFGETNRLWVADTFNHKVKLLNLTSATTATLLSELGSGLPEHRDSSFGATAQFHWPRGLVWWSNNSTLLIADTGNHVIRAATNYTFGGQTAYATNYSISTFAGVPKVNGFTDGPANEARFDTPVGLAVDGELESFLVTDLKNNAIRRIQSGPVRPPVSAPRIGWVDFVWNDALGTFVTALRTEDQPRVFNNEVYFAILEPESGVECKYTTTTTIWPPPFLDVGENPSKTLGANRPPYVNGETMKDFMDNLGNRALGLKRDSELGGVVIKAIAYQFGRQSSPVVKANYGFKVATPAILGDNLASFKVTTATVDPAPELRYTVDGADPSLTNGTVVPEGGALQLAFTEGQTNVVVKVRGFATDYLPSDIASKTFTPDGFVPNKISFGFPNGEASSEFIASAGQSFYAPVTLTLLPDAKMYSLQFNVSVTNLGSAPPVTPGYVDFVSMLEKPDEFDKNLYHSIPPAMFLGITTNWVVVTNVIGTDVFVTTNLVLVPGSSDPPPTNRIIYPFVNAPWSPFQEMRFVNSAANLVAVGWLERYGQKNLYDTTKQDLIKYSQPHDRIFDEDGGRVVPGGFMFLVPGNATDGHQYRIQIGRPSATSDGVGAPGSDVYIDTPTNGTLAGGAINSVKHVTVGQRNYIAGDVTPFRWFNAGDFGNSNILNDDVLQVFQAVIYNLNYPPPGSDFFDAMDSGCTLGTPVGDGTYVPSTTLSGASQNVLFDGDDTLINDIAFGDGELNVADVYITFRRSLDPSLTWFQRYWKGGIRVAEIVPNRYRTAKRSSPRGAGSGSAASAEAPSVQFLAGEVLGVAGQTVQIPITARVHGGYPLRTLLLSLSVQALEGTPALTDAIGFVPAALGQPTSGLIQQHLSKYSAAWLNSAVGGLRSNALLGTLTVKIPTNAYPGAAYAIHFDHASGSPNGLAAFSSEVEPGLITLGDRSGSSQNDGIPDSWRLRHFGSVYALLGLANADADGDGHCNREEFKAGTNPNDAQSVLKVMSGQPAAQFVVRWPSVAGKRYVIERAAALFGASWQPVGTNTGTGWEMGFEDPDHSGAPRFYRVLVAE